MSESTIRDLDVEPIEDPDDQGPDERAAASRGRSATPHAGLAILALALGGFGIGTTEFVTMGLLPQIADGIDVSIPTAGHVVSAYALGRWR